MLENAGPAPISTLEAGNAADAWRVSAACATAAARLEAGAAYWLPRRARLLPSSCAVGNAV